MTGTICCPGCGARFTSEEVLIAWLNGKIPNTLSCPICGEIAPSLLGRGPGAKRMDIEGANVKRLKNWPEL